jgi:hypothetical protein
VSFTVNKQRQKTMLERIGDAAELVDNLAYLPFFRSVQIKLEKMGKADEWGKMIAAAKAKGIENPKMYFAKLCRRVRDGTYTFAEKVKEITGKAALFISDKIVRFKFGKYQKYWVRRVDEFINLNGMAAFIELLEYAERKGISQKYFARAILNGKAPRKYYEQNIMGAAAK